MAVDDIPTLETFTEGDTKAVVYGTAVDRNGEAINLTGKTLTIEGRKRGTAAAFTPVAVVVTSAPLGQWESDLAALVSPAGSAGELRCQVRVTEGGTFFRSDPFKVPVRTPSSAGGV